MISPIDMLKKPILQSGGYIMILNVVLFIAILMTILVGVVNPILSQYGSSHAFLSSKQAYLAAQSGLEEALYRLKNGISVPASFAYANGSSGSANVAITSTATGKNITSRGSLNGFIRVLTTDLYLGTGISFHYGIQSGDGGFYLQNTSSVTGNVFSGGPVIGSGSNMIYGDVISSNSNGQIYGIHATGTAYAHIIGDPSQPTTIDKDAHYVTLTNTTVGGTKYPASADLPDAPLPISDSQIAQWESDAAAGGMATCTNGSYDITSAVTLGPIEIPCDLNIKGTTGGFTVTVGGPIWVVGNINESQNALIAMSPSLGSENVAIIADSPGQNVNSAIITLSNKASFQGSGAPGSYVFMISQNSSAEQTGGSTNAINVGQSSNALVGYAIHGLITLAQSVSLKEATAYKIVLTQSSNVTYDTGLPNALFEAGPGGGYDIIDWLEI